MIILSFCSFPWWLSWLLPFLLGWALGWAMWSKYKSISADLEGKVSSLNGKVTNLEADIKGHTHRIAELDGDVAIAKGKMREAEDALTECQKQAKEMSSGNNSKGKDVQKDKGSMTSKESDNANSPNTGSASKSESASDLGTNIKDTGNLIGGAAGFTAGSIKDTGLGDSSIAPMTSSGSSGKKYAALKPHNLQIIEGIGPKMEEVLKESGITSWSELSNKSADELRAILDTYGDKYKIIDVTTWQQQAKYAAQNDFDGLITMQKSIDGGRDNTISQSDSKLEKYLVKTGAIKQFKKDDLKAVEGIGPKIEGLLKDAGINTWKELSEASADKINQILEDAGPRYKLADPTTWPKQAEMAHNGQWDDLREYQDFLNGGKE